MIGSTMNMWHNKANLNLPWDNYTDMGRINLPSMGLLSWEDVRVRLLVVI